MKKETVQRSKELYRAFRSMSFEKLWNEVRSEFENATAKERLEIVVFIRALTAAALGNGRRCEIVRAWVAGLLEDSLEKVRRYAVNALPKLGAGEKEESLLLALLERTTSKRERSCLLEALAKIGREASLKALEQFGIQAQEARQRILAGLARKSGEGKLVFDRCFRREDLLSALKIHLRCRRGLEKVLSEEVKESESHGEYFVVKDVRPGLVILDVKRTFFLKQILAWRCWQSVGFVLGEVPDWDNSGGEERIARLICSEFASEIARSFTQGVARYRLELIRRGARRGFVKEVVRHASRTSSELVNYTREALWSVDVYPPEECGVVELRPRLVPDPRFSYRVADVPAASHPPLAAAMARLARPATGDVVWDPFCGSGVELVECALVNRDIFLVGTDVSREALDAAQKNMESAGLDKARVKLLETDFRSVGKCPVFEKGVDVIITNPPMGRRVPVGRLKGIINELFSVAGEVLKKGGRFVFVNPLKNWSVQQRGISLVNRSKVDMGGFDGWLEHYIKHQR